MAEIYIAMDALRECSETSVEERFQDEPGIRAYYDSLPQTPFDDIEKWALCNEGLLNPWCHATPPLFRDPRWVYGGCMPLCCHGHLAGSLD